MVILKFVRLNLLYLQQKLQMFLFITQDIFYQYTLFLPKGSLATQRSISCKQINSNQIIRAPLFKFVL